MARRVPTREQAEAYGRWVARSFAVPFGLAVAAVLMMYVGGGAHTVSPLARHIVWTVASAAVAVCLVVFVAGAARMRQQWEVRETVERSDVLAPALMIPAGLACLAEAIYFGVTKPLGHGTPIIPLALMLAGINVLGYGMARYDSVAGWPRTVMLICAGLAGAVAAADLFRRTPDLGLFSGGSPMHVVTAFIVVNAIVMLRLRRKRMQS